VTTLDETFRAVVRRIIREEFVAEIEAAVERALVVRSEAKTPANLTVEETASLLRCSPRTVHRYIARRRLDSVKVGAAGRVLVPQASVDRLLKTWKR
jgi:excisionase family DNA binding protein